MQVQQFVLFSVLAVLYLLVAGGYARDIRPANRNPAADSSSKVTMLRPMSDHVRGWDTKKPGMKKLKKKPTGLQRQTRAIDESMLDALSLSYGGDFNMADTFRQGRELANALITAMGGLVDLKMVRSLVDGLFENLSASAGANEGRSRPVMEDDSQVELKRGITTLVGAALGEQECWQRSACLAGEYAASIPGKDVLFIVLDRLAPTTWVQTLDTVKQSATYIQDCNRFECSTDPEGTESDA